MKKANGFTLVELLIVIVVIAILAAITLVAYNGIQARAQQVAVKSDIRNLSQMIKAYEIDNDLDIIVLGNEVTGGNYADFPGIKFSPSKSAYSSGGNLYICKLRTGGDYIAIGAKTKAGDVIAWRSDKGYIDYSAEWTTSGTICPALLESSGPFWFSYGQTTSGVWNGWTN